MKIRNIAANMLTVLAVLGIAGLAVLGVAREAIKAPGPSTAETTLSIPKGSNLHEISVILGKSGVLPESAVMGIFSGPALFRISANISRKAQLLKFGEYAIAPGASVAEILRLLEKGGNVHHRITIPEGLTTSMAIDRLLAEGKLTGEIGERPAEGSLLPETYSFERGTTKAEVIQRMQADMQRVLDEAWAGRDPNLPLATKQELLILASIIEKETKPREHGKVASVFVNRLNKGMKLQTDPTVIYGITLGRTASLGRGLRRSELNAATPYNTYVIPGLPPTPICNPGVESIRAAANPEETNYLFFVANGTGGHAFAETNAEHNRNVAEWRRIEAERNANE